jgi:hypothetical protein
MQKHKLIINFNVSRQIHEYEINNRKLHMNYISMNLIIKGIINYFFL